MPSDDYNIKTKRTKKDDKAKKNFDRNGKFSSKYIRIKEELLAKAITRNQSYD
jgi:hypothetical protein